VIIGFLGFCARPNRFITIDLRSDIAILRMFQSD